MGFSCCANELHFNEKNIYILLIVFHLNRNFWIIFILTFPRCRFTLIDCRKLCWDDMVWFGLVSVEHIFSVKPVSQYFLPTINILISYFYIILRLNASLTQPISHSFHRWWWRLLLHKEKMCGKRQSSLHIRIK